MMDACTQGEFGQFCVLEEEADAESQIMSSDELQTASNSYKTDAETWQGGRWIMVRSIVDSGASNPVAPPQMAPNVPITPSPGSLRGQVYGTAGKEKLSNLGQQHIKACTAEGHETEVLFQIADVKKPLVSVSTICERGNRVLFGKSGGVIQNITSGVETPFFKKNGVYVLDMWLQDEPAPFPRQP